jgi:hypothetical protein
MPARDGEGGARGRTGFAPDPEWPSIVELAREVWGEPNRPLSRRDDVRFGSKGSKSVKPSTNTWHDHETRQGGGYIELHREARGEPPPRKPISNKR